MKLFKTTGFILLFSSVFFTGSIYNYSFTKIEGGTQTMTALQGKKILIVTLPIQQNASADSMLYCLDTLAAAHTVNLAVIGVPSYEDGYTATQQTQLKNWYRSKLGNYIIISTGLYTRKTSGTQQHGLFKWLTTDTMNDAFNMDVAGPGYKFFVNSTGALFGVLTPQTKMGGANVQRTLRIQ
jgi:glutathione peroxidase-family protein